MLTWIRKRVFWIGLLDTVLVFGWWDLDLESLLESNTKKHKQH